MSQKISALRLTSDVGVQVLSCLHQGSDISPCIQNFPDILFFFLQNFMAIHCYREISLKTNKYKPHGGTKGQCQGVVKVSGIHHLGTMDTCTKF